MTDPVMKLPPRQLRILKRDHKKSAHAVDLRHVRDSMAGIERIRHGRNFRYRYKGAPVKDEETLARIKKLAIPPAWTDVWICPHPKGHLQATGKDARGRKQYRYHADWALVRSRTKFHHMLEFGMRIPAIRAQLRNDLATPGLTREKVLATVISLMDLTNMRVGNPEYEKENGSYGLSTLKDRHVKGGPGGVRLVFKGKTGITHNIKIRSRELARLVMRCKEVPGQELFQYIDEDGESRPIDSGMVNDRIRELSEGEFTSKDLRTWKGTVHCLTALIANTCPDNANERKTAINQALDETAKLLGNTRAVCRKYYVHPDVISSYECRKLNEILSGEKKADRILEGEHTLEERLVLKVLSAARRAAKQ